MGNIEDLALSIATNIMNVHSNEEDKKQLVQKSHAEVRVILIKSEQLLQRKYSEKGNPENQVKLYIGGVAKLIKIYVQYVQESQKFYPHDIDVFRNAIIGQICGGIDRLSSKVPESSMQSVVNSIQNNFGKGFGLSGLERSDIMQGRLMNLLQTLINRSRR